MSIIMEDLNMCDLTLEFLKEILHYCPNSGDFTRLQSRGNTKKGDIAAPIDDRGYIKIRIGSRAYRGHRLAWFYYYGEFPNMEIDHINGIKTDNRIENLRLATHAENCKNQGVRKNNTSGYKGVRKTRHGSWLAGIGVNGEWIYLGVYPTPEEASDAYKEAADYYYGEFHRLCEMS